MIEDIKLDTFPKESGVYMFKTNDEVIYVGSSKNLYKRMIDHRNAINKGGNNNGASKQDLYQYLQTNQFTVEFKTTDNYRQLEQELVEKYHPKFNAIRAYTGLGTFKGREAEYKKQYNEKYKESHKKASNKYNKSDKGKETRRKARNKYNKSDKGKEYYKQYQNQLCLYEGETITLSALSTRFRRQGIPHPVLEAKKYLIMSNNN